MESSAEEQENSWITNFCGQRGHEYFCAVDRNYIEDGFNLYGLKSVVENFGECLDVILDRIEPDESDAATAEDARATTELYGLIHARYIVTSHGLDAMHAKYLRREFGSCPRYFCDNCPVLPIGMNDAVGVSRVNLYCPRCRQVFRVNAPDYVDGAYFGTTFPHLFLMTFGFPRCQDETDYVPRVFGFRLHRSAYQRGTLGAVSTTPPQGRRPREDHPFISTRKRPRDDDDDDDDDDLDPHHYRSRHHHHHHLDDQRRLPPPSHVLINNHYRSGGPPGLSNPMAFPPPGTQPVPRFHDSRGPIVRRDHH